MRESAPRDGDDRGWDLSCSSAERLIARGRFGDPALRAHTDRCPECRREFEGARWVRPILAPSARRAAGTNADPLFLRTVLARARAETSPVRRREARRTRRLVGSSLLTLVLLAGSLHTLTPPGAERGAPDPSDGGATWTVVRTDEASSADQFLLGRGEPYLSCEWIPSAEGSLVDGHEVRF